MDQRVGSPLPQKAHNPHNMKEAQKEAQNLKEGCGSSRGRDWMGDEGRKRRRKLEKGMESSWDRPQAEMQPQQKIQHQAIISGWTAQANLHHFTSNLCLKAQGFNKKPKAKQNISHSSVSLIITLYFLSLNQLLNHTLLSFRLQSKLLSHDNNINSTHFIIDFAAWLFSAKWFTLFKFPTGWWKWKTPELLHRLLHITFWGSISHS